MSTHGKNQRSSSQHDPNNAERPAARPDKNLEGQAGTSPGSAPFSYNEPPADEQGEVPTNTDLPSHKK